jgi:cell division transport system permease protein
MKSLKNHFSFIIPLFVLLFSYQFSHTLNTIAESYEKNLSDNYSIVAIALKNLDEKIVKQTVDEVTSIEEIESQKVLDRFKKDLSSVNVKLLETMLPKFYIVKLDRFPSKSEEIASIKKRLLKVPYVTKVETFSKTHSELSRIMALAKMMVSVFTVFVVIVSFLLLFKQIEVWTYEHRERVEIMELFGAPFWMKSAILYKLVVIDSIICVILVSGIFMSFMQSSSVIALSKDIGFGMPEFLFVPDAVILLLISLSVSILSVTYMMLRKKSAY